MECVCARKDGREAGGRGRAGRKLGEPPRLAKRFSLCFDDPQKQVTPNFFVSVGGWRLARCPRACPHTTLLTTLQTPCMRTTPRTPARATSMRPPRATPSSDTPRASVLYCCLGNICRSPAAEAVFQKLVNDRGLPIRVDSCGTGGGSRDWFKAGGFSYHEGDPADPRMSAAAAARGFKLTSRSRPLTPGDLITFDRVITMDAANERAVAAAAAHWRETGALKGEPTARVERLTTYLRDDKLKKLGRDGVPDPYYGSGSSGFNLVLDMLTDACDALLDDVVAELGHAE